MYLPLSPVFLQAVFWRLTKESISLALHSCFGGQASGFHIKFLSNNHFHSLLPPEKQVGFHIYQLRHVIRSTFDVYFHLWNKVHLTRNKKNMFGRRNRRTNGLLFSPKVIRDWQNMSSRKTKLSGLPRRLSTAHPRSRLRRPVSSMITFGAFSMFIDLIPKSFKGLLFRFGSQVVVCQAFNGLKNDLSFDLRVTSTLDFESSSLNLQFYSLNPRRPIDASALVAKFQEILDFEP